MPSLKLDALLNISQIDLTKPLKQILEEILVITGREMNAHSGTIFLVNDETGELELVATLGLPDDYIGQVSGRGPVTRSPSGIAVKTGQCYLVPDVSKEPKLKPWQDMLYELGIAAQIFMPMKEKGEVIGLLNIYLADSHEFTEDEIAFLSVAAGQAAAVIENAKYSGQLEELVNERTAELNMSNEHLLKEITGRKRVEERLKGLSKILQIDLTTELNLVLREILAIMGSEINAHSGTMMLVSEETGELEMVATYGLPDDYIERVYSREVPITCSPSGVVIESGEYYVVPNIFEEPRDKPWADLGRELGFSAQIFMPLKQRGEVVGVLVIYMADPHKFTDDEITFLRIAAGQAAAIIEDARLYVHILQKKEELEREIAERKRAEEALRESKGHLSNILSASPIGIGLVEIGPGGIEDRRLSWTNERMKELFGFEHGDDEYMGKNAEVIYASRDEYERVSNLFRKGLEEGNTADVEAKLKRKDGSLFDGHIRTNFLDPSDPAKGAVATISDISWRKQAEEKLRLNEQTLNALVNAPTDLVFLMDLKGNLLALNKPFAQRFGKSVDEFIGVSVYDLFPPDIAQSRREVAQKVIRSKEPISYEDVVEDDFFDIRLYPILDSEGEVNRLAIFVRNITVQKRAAEKLRESEEKYRTLVDNVQDGIFIIQGREHPRLVYCNEAFARMVGYTVEEALELTFEEYIAPEDLAMVANRYRLRQLGVDVPREYEYRALHKDGKTQVDINMHVGIIEINSEVSSIGTVKNVTERKQAEKELRESEEMYRTLFENTGTAMLIVEEDMTISAINDEMEHVAGYSKEELEGRLNWSEMVVKDYLEKILEYHHKRRIDPSAAPKTYEFQFIHKQGDVRDASLTAAIIPGTGKSVISIKDITEHKRAEEALRTSEERFRSFFDNLSVGVAMRDPFGSIIAVNKTFCSFIGYTQEELIGKHFSELTYSEDLNECKGLFNSLIKGERDSYLIDKRYVRKDGELIWGRLYISGIRDKDGELKYATVICEDITEYKRVEESLLTKKKELENAMDELTRVEDALKKTEKKYKEIAEFLPDLIYKTIMIDS